LELAHHGPDTVAALVAAYAALAAGQDAEARILTLMAGRPCFAGHLELGSRALDQVLRAGAAAD